MAIYLKRIEIILIIFMVIFLLLAGRLIYLQGLNGKNLAKMGLLSRVQELQLTPVRGEIFDRNLQQLTNRHKYYSVIFFPDQCQLTEQTAQTLANYIKLPIIALQHQMLTANQPVKIATALSKTTADKLRALALKGVVICEETDRYSDLASHLIGYVDQSDCGSSGIEARYDNLLNTGGSMYLAALLDAQATLIPGLQYHKINLTINEKPQALVLTIDARIQQQSEIIFDRWAQKGAVVVLAPYTGEILAMVSRPNFNAEHLADYLTADDAPLVNRAIMAYQPGSVFKLAVAAAALENGLVREDEVFWDLGYIDVLGTIFNGWDYKRGPHQLTFSEAVAVSSNPVFIEVGLRLGMDRLVPFFEQLGFGSKTPANLVGEATGNLPPNDQLNAGETANLAIGQGQCEVTPLQIAALIATIVNDGKKIEPLLIDRILDEHYQLISKPIPPAAKQVFSPTTAAALRRMMEGVTRHGTGRAAFVTPGGSAGKTGSAETGRYNAFGTGISHAWFGGFAPLKNPKYTVVVFVEEGMSGGDVAAPIFREIVEAIAKI